MKNSLSNKMRPRTISEVVGQKHLIGEGRLLTRIVKSKALSSIILYGPPGVGKTSIAKALSKDLEQRFEYFNASVHGKEELKKIVDNSTNMFPSVVLIDEIHRLNKQNQDYLLMKLEDGVITIVGATTENPYMSVNPAIRSRSKILELKKISKEDIKEMLEKTLTDERGFSHLKIEFEDGCLDQIASFSNGDLRSALNTLELIVNSTESDSSGLLSVSKDDVAECLQSSSIDGDSGGDAHYNLLSAFQKSIRGSDTDASLHYLARLIKIGDIQSIHRRLLVIAYEDIGLANPALVTETLNSIQSSERVGFPESRIILSYIVTRLALSAKSNITYKAIKKAQAALETGRNMDIPVSLHDSHYKGSEKLGKGEGYKYAHDYPFGIAPQKFLPEEFIKDSYLEFRDEKDLPQMKNLYENLHSYNKK